MKTTQSRPVIVLAVSFLYPLIFSLVVSTAGTVAFGQDSVLNRTVPEIILSKGELTAPLQFLASSCDVPIGFEPTVNTNNLPKKKSEEIVLRDRTLTEILDTLVTLNPDYQWRFAKDVVEFFPAQSSGSFTFLNVKVDLFVAKNLTVDEIKRKLVSQVEVSNSLKKQGLEVKELTFMPGANSLDSKTSIKSTNAPVRAILNSVLLTTDRNYWSISQWGETGQYISIIIN